MSSLLVVEDDRTIGTLLESGLRADGHQVAWCREGREAIEAARRRAPDVVLLDLGLPDLDGVEVCRTLRGMHPSTVILMVTARREVVDIVLGLDAGADDYITKPFSLEEVLARLRARLRRGQAARTSGSFPVITCGSLRVDLAARRCHVGDQEATLRTKEFDLLARLSDPPGSAVSRETLMHDVWPGSPAGSTKTLDVTMASLRHKLEWAALASRVTPPVITTVRGHGYRLEPDPEGSGPT